MPELKASGKIIIKVSHPAPAIVASIMDGIKEEMGRYALEEGIEDEIEIKEENV